MADKKKSPNNKKITEFFSPAPSSSGGDEKTTGGQSTKLRTDVVIPQSKIKSIMKSSPEIDQIGADSVFILAKATELFIDHLTTLAYAGCKGNKNLQYKNLSEAVQKANNLEFLKEIVPTKITARLALQEIAKQKQIDNKELLD